MDREGARGGRGEGLTWDLSGAQVRLIARRRAHRAHVHLAYGRARSARPKTCTGQGGPVTPESSMSLLMIILLVLLVLSIGGGGAGYKRFGALGMSPAALIVVVLVVLYFTGSLR